MAFLASEPTNLGHGHPLHADIRQRLAYGIELERFDDRNQHFHGWAPKGVRKFSIAPKQPISRWGRSEEHTSELQSLMRISYAVFCLKKKTTLTQNKNRSTRTQFGQT